ncbi:hypothetical protein [Candidatus Enterococcus murrayae]|uniref:Uncharacterized protein n=1 Tax=Candidatus Enterococcus murrayae TaxID=2815321 RepID=A0ABS3HMW2_9ENTE|nr:hypothetical protein [Enterococcus sp. MJM16]MBO0454215.1 hypothetical protein [Enterococcus sp. MJM16]
MKFVEQFDAWVYQTWKKFKGLTEKQQQFTYCLLILLAFFLISLINEQADNNAMWLDGSWKGPSDVYLIKSKKDECEYWDIKQNDFFLMENAQIAVNSSKRNIVLTKNSGNTEYHIIKLDRKRIILQIFNNQKKIKELGLERIK